MASRPSLREKLRAKQNGECCYCGVRMLSPGRKLNGAIHPQSETLEHLQRKEEGGGNHYDNMALACHSCNIGRSGMDWFTYATFRRGEFWEVA